MSTTVSTKMTAIANEIRTLSDTASPLGLDAMAERVEEANEEVASQEDLIADIIAALEGKSIESDEPILQAKTATASTERAVVVTPDTGYDGLAQVTIDAIPTAEQAVPSISVSAAGEITASATQTDGYVAAGTKSATKQMTVQGAQTIIPGTSDQTIASGRYLTGTQTIKGDANLLAENIRSGASIFGVDGGFEGDAGSFPNGTEWTKSNLGHEVQGAALKYADGIWVLAGTGIYYSTDGKTWTQSNAPEIIFNDLAYGGGVWVAASDSSVPYYSTDGKVWTQCTGIEGYLTQAAYSDGMWVAGSEKNIGLWYSEDGKSWAQSNITTGRQYVPAVRGNGMWVAETRGTPNGIFYSTDGKTWTKSNAADATTQLFYANGMWQADTFVGLLYSFDGKTWSESNMALGGSACNDMRYASGIWVGAMYDGLYYSTDGKVWIASNITYDDNAAIIAYGNGTWTATVQDFGTYYSTDGKTWTKSNDAYMFEIAYANGVWVGSQWPDVSEDDYSLFFKPMLYSVDGKTWHESTIIDGILGLFANNNGIWVAAGSFNAGPYYSVTWEPTT